MSYVVGKFLPTSFKQNYELETQDQKAKQVGESI